MIASTDSGPTSPRKRAYMAVYNEERYAMLRAAGLCVRCKGPAEPGFCMCPDCAEHTRTRQRRAWRRALGRPLDTPAHARGQRVVNSGKSAA